MSASYERPPITEAVIEVRCAGRPATQKQLVKIARRLEKTYPILQQAVRIEAHIDATGDDVAVTRNEEGFRCTSDDQADIVLVKPNGLATCRLAPYLGWETLYPQARDNWRAWRRQVSSRPAERIGVRYINRIDIPKSERSAIQLEDYLRVHPTAPNLSSNGLGGFMVQVSASLEAEHWQTTIRLAPVVPSPIPGASSILLDLDVYRMEELPQHDDDLWRIVEEGRSVKNHLFEMCITDQSRGLFSK